jgi:hypothetical protein
MAARRLTWLVVDDIGIVPLQAVIDQGEFGGALRGGAADWDHWRIQCQYNRLQSDMLHARSGSTGIL